MPQGCVIKIPEKADAHLVQASHGNLLGVTPGSPDDQLMGHEHLAGLRYKGLLPHMGDGAPHRVLIALYLFLRPAFFHHRRLDKRKHIHVHAAVCIPKLYRAYMAVIHRSHVHPALFHQAAAKGNPLRAVVVSAYDEHMGSPVRQSCQKAVKEPDRLSRRNRLIIYIPGDEHGIRRLLLQDALYLFYYVPLVLQHGKLIYPFSQMEVRYMCQAHCHTSLASASTTAAADRSSTWMVSSGSLMYSR